MARGHLGSPMIADLDADGPDELSGYDLVVVGSGPAGSTLARELCASGLRIAVLESGLRRPTARGDAQRRTVSEGIHLKDWSRERVFGGASTTWAGLSAPLDPIDFEPRAWIGGACWPLERSELERWLALAAERYRFPALAAFAPGGFARLRERGELHPRWERLDEKVFLAAAEPQDWAREHRASFEREGVDLFLDATVLRLEREPADAGRVACALVRTRGGRERRVRARAFVLATGGIENARLLLLSQLGNAHDQVGRCLMNHPKSYFGVVRLARAVESAPYYFGCLWEGFAGYAGLRLSEDEQRRRRVLNAYVRFEPLFPWTGSEGIEALVTMLKRSKGLLSAWKRRRGGALVELRDWSETGDDSELQNARKDAAGWLGLVGKVLLDLPRVARYLWHRLVPGAKLRIRAARVRAFLEMEPRPENRVTLAAERDADGQPLPHVRHEPSALDRRSLLELYRELAAELEREGLGRLEGDLAAADPWPIDEDASHHMGTTRMSDDPARGVVDRDLRVHGLENLWVAGASVFPTSGCANPTFTLVALSIRLAEHLRAALRAPARSA